MTVLSYDAFKDYYRRRGRCPNDSMVRKNPLNEKQLQTRYKQYTKSEERKAARYEEQLRKAKEKKFQEKADDSEWREVANKVHKRDNEECQLLKVLTPEEKKELLSNAGGFIHTLDPAHVFRKSSYPHMKYDVGNIYLLNRYSHSNLDNQKSPINGKSITPMEAVIWWIRIVGNTKYAELLEKAKKR